MTAAYLVANAAWVVLFGDQIIDLDGRRFFDSRPELCDALARKGLRLNRNNTIDPVVQIVMVP
jgi:hypothetical protein